MPVLHRFIIHTVFYSHYCSAMFQVAEAVPKQETNEDKRSEGIGIQRNRNDEPSGGVGGDKKLSNFSSDGELVSPATYVIHVPCRNV